VEEAAKWHGIIKQKRRKMRESMIIKSRWPSGEIRAKNQAMKTACNVRPVK
jgi:hypothetical protein